MTQTHNHASIPQLSFLQARCPSWRRTNSIKVLKLWLSVVSKSPLMTACWCVSCRQTERLRKEVEESQRVLMEGLQRADAQHLELEDKLSRCKINIASERLITDEQLFSSKQRICTEGVRLLSATSHHTHTHTTILQPSSILSGTTRVSRHQKGKTNLDLLEQEIVSDSSISWAICKSAP